MSAWQLLVLAGTWLIYFALHSLFASLRVKQAVAHHHPQWMPAYRLTYNAVAVLLLIPPLLLTFLWRAEPLWVWSGIGAWLANGLTALAVLGFWWTSKCYDGSEFLGLRQWRERERKVEDQERFRLSPVHRYVRHPWYFLGLVLIWTRDMDPALLLTAIAISAYFVIGSRLEDRKLIAYHGEVYRRYRQRVCGLVPLPWRRLSEPEAQRLLGEP